MTAPEHKTQKIPFNTRLSSTRRSQFDPQRTSALAKRDGCWSLTMLREKLVKVGAKVIRHDCFDMFQMAEVAVPSKPVSGNPAADR
jgi:hypothetical protein